MADKKITALTEATTAASEDLLHIIDDPGGSPVNKKLTIKNFLGDITHTTNTASETTTEVLSGMTLNINAVASSTDTYDNVRALFVNTQMTYSTGANNKVESLVGADINITTNQANVYCLTELVGTRVTLDRNTENASSSANSYVLVLKAANTATSQTKAVTAFIKCEDKSTGSTVTTEYFLDVPTGSGSGTGNNAAYGAAFHNGTDVTSGTAAGFILVRIGGQDRKIPLYA